MRIIEAPTFKDYLLAKIATREFSKRSGVHCSDLIYCLNKQAMRRLHPEPPTEQELLTYSLGWATQRWLTGVEKDVDEIEEDGIIVTCDALGAALEPWELKATFQSSNKPIEENVHWIRQIEAQCYVTKTTEAHLTRFEIMGNWKSIFGKKEEKALPENQKPTLHAYRLSFTQEELNRTWAWLKERRLLFLDLLAGASLLPKPIAVPSGQLWECEWCKYQCGGDVEVE